MKNFLGVLNAVALAALIGMFVWFFWPRPEPVPGPVPAPSAEPSTEDPPDAPPTGPESVVESVFKQMGNGKLDKSTIAYRGAMKPDLVLRSRDMYGHVQKFHGVVKFPLTDVKISPFDPKTESVRYSIRVPHPCVMFWQWCGMYPEDLPHIPPGLPMEGVFKLARSSSGAWQVVAERGGNPVNLYGKVSIMLNQIWLNGIKTGTFRGKMHFSTIMLFVTYAVAMGISEDDAPDYAEKLMGECDSVLPMDYIPRETFEL